MSSSGVVDGRDGGDGLALDDDVIRDDEDDDDDSDAVTSKTTRGADSEEGICTTHAMPPALMQKTADAEGLGVTVIGEGRVDLSPGRADVDVLGDMREIGGEQSLWEFAQWTRRELEEIVELLSCPSGCDHTPGSDDCRKWMWTVVHKGDFELCLWQDSQLIISYGNFFSATRCGLLGRGASLCSHNLPKLTKMIPTTTHRV